MLTRIQIQSTSQRNLTFACLFVLASTLIGMGGALPRSLHADDSPRVRATSSEPIEEVADSDEEEMEPEEPIRRRRIIEPEEIEEPEQTPQRVVGNGVGTMGRASHLAGKTFGRNDSITPLEYMPYLLTNEHFIFGDLRGFVTNTSQGGGNLGVGYRRLFDNWNAWAGVSAWYDADQSTSKMFQQVGLSFEGLIQQFEFRSNVYLPVTSTQTSNTISNATIVGNQLLYSRSIGVGTPLQGVDAEVGYSLPVMDRHVVRGYVGGYHFEGGSTGGVNGFKARVEGVINNTITAQALYTHDKLYGDNLMVGVSMQFPFASDHPTTGWTRNTPSPFRFVERNYNVIVAQSRNSAANQVATDPATGNPYVIEQVGSPGPGTPNGTTANPFTSVAAAQAAGGDVILVQSGTVLNQPITLTSGQHLFGQGNFSESLATTGGGNVPIPNLLQAATTPIIQNVTGDAVTLASNTEVAGFNIIGPTGNGISGNGVSGVSLHDLTFSSIGGDAINLTNSSSSVAISNIDVTSVFGNGIVFNGGNPNIAFNGGGQTISAQGNGFVLQNLTGGSAAINNLSLNNIGGTGLVLSSVAAGVNVDSLTVNQSGTNSGSAVVISGTTGTPQIVNFTGTTNITSPNGVGFSVSGTDAIVNVGNLNVTSTSSQPAVSVVNATSAIAFGNMTVNTQNGMGLFANNASNLQVHGGSFTAVNGPAIDIESSTFIGKLGSVSANGGPYGIKLEASTGTFALSGGTIQNTTTAGVLINSFGSTSVSSVNFLNNAVAIQSTGSAQLGLSNLKITGSTGYAIDSLNDTAFSLSGSTFSSNGAIGGGTVRIQASTVGTFTSVVENNTITDVNGTAIQLLTQAGGAGATLLTQISGNTIVGYANGSSIIDTNWTGPVTATISTNTIYVYGSNMTGVSLQDPTTSALLTATINSNPILFEHPTATGGTGILVVDGQSGQSSTGSSNLTLTSNNIAFQATGGTGMRFGLYAASSDLITTNAITDQAGGATGILFDNVASGTNTQLTGNIVNLLAGDPTLHRGIIFSQVAPNFTLVTPFNTTSNSIFNATSAQTTFSIPAGTGAGGIVINGNFLQAPNF